MSWKALMSKLRSRRHVSARFVTPLRLELLGILALAVTGLLAITMSSSATGGTFAPTLTFETSTTHATSNPDARITIDNSNSSDDIKSLTMDLPKGMWGSLAAGTQCAYATAQTNGCTSASQIGTVTTDATIDDNQSRLHGKIYLTTAAPANAATDPAGIAIVVPAKVGGVDLGPVVVNARAVVRLAPTSPSDPTGVVGAMLGLRTIVDDIPNSITDSHSRKITFHIQKMVVDLVSKLGGSRPPLLINSSVCTAGSLAATITSYGSQTVTPSVPYKPTGCSSLRLAPTKFDFTTSPTAPTAGQEVGLTTEMDFPANSPSLSSVDVKMPPMVGPNFPAFGFTTDQCPSSSAPTTTKFSPDTCPSPSGNPGHPELGPAKVGTMSLETPLLPDPLIGDVYLISKSPIPWFGIDFNPSVAVTNPKGVTIRIVGANTTLQVDPGCDPVTLPDPSGSCQTQVRATFASLPDAPASKMTLTLDGPGRTGGSGSLSGKMLVMASNSDLFCQPADDYTGTFVSNAGSSIRSDQIDTQSLAGGCQARDTVIDSNVSSPAGLSTVSTTPSFSFSGTGPFDCAVDGFALTSQSCTSPFTTGTLSVGPHRLYVQGADRTTRAFVITPPAPTIDSTPPDTSIDSGPTGNTTDLSPVFTFSTTDGTAALQCTVDSGAYLPCTSPYTAGPFFTGSTHTFSVRAQDPTGNVTPALNVPTATFSTVTPFGPTLSVTSSTHVARAHPDLDVEIDSLSNEGIKDLTFRMPEGLFGGLQGVGATCPLSLANAGNCPASSRIGTVDTETLVDESILHISGEVFMTDPIQTGDPAGLSIKVPAKIQDVNIGNIIVPARMTTDGEFKEMDTVAVNVPNHVTPDPLVDPWDSTTFFNMRKMTMHLRTNPAGTQPLMTNPSSCDAGSFGASFTGYSSTTSTASLPYPVTGCDALNFTPSFSAEVHKPDGSPPDASDLQSIDMSVTINSSPDDAGMKETSVLLPKPLTMDVGKLPPVCEQTQWDAKACPANTRIGTAMTSSPLLALTDPPLSGPVYALRGNHTALPRIGIRLEGRVSIGFVGTTSFENGTQIRTNFTGLPDSPLTIFKLSINGLMRTMKKPCQLGDQYGYSLTGNITAFNGKTAGIDSPLKFDCAGVAYKYAFKKSGKRSKFKLAMQVQGSKAKLKSVKIQLPKYLTFIKRGVKRKIVLTADGKKLKSKCLKYVKPNLVTSGLCGKQVSKLEINFKPGSLNAAKKLRRGKVKITTVDVAKHSHTDSLNIFSKAFKSFAMP